jgi:hypothetical protein
MRILAAIGLFVALSATANAQLQIFEASLDGAQEDPIVVTPGIGVGSAVFNPATNMLNVSVSFSGLTGTTIDAHIHCCFGEPGDLPGRNSSVAVGFMSHSFPLGVTSGNFLASIDLLNSGSYTPGFLTEGGGTAAGARDKLLAGMSQAPDAGGAYFNIHTTTRQTGEIRGDISRIPEPTALALVLCGLAAIALQRRGR